MTAADRAAIVELVELDEAERLSQLTESEIGRVVSPTPPHCLADLADRMPEHWAPNRTARTIAVPLQRLTGRRLIAVPADGGEGRA